MRSTAAFGMRMKRSRCRTCSTVKRRRRKTVVQRCQKSLHANTAVCARLEKVDVFTLMI